MPILRDPPLDSAPALLRQGYDWIGNTAARLDSDAFHARIGLRRALVSFGADAAAMFYDGRSFSRQGALPPTTLRLLQDKASVMALDGPPHHWRKRLFLDILTPAAEQDMAGHFADQVRRALPLWRKKQEISVLAATTVALTAAARAWVGITPRTPRALGRLSFEFAEMVLGAGRVAAPVTFDALRRRRGTEAWAMAAIRDARATPGAYRARSPILAVATWRDWDGEALTERAAAVELINLMRPTIANARYLAFAALALHRHPEWRRRLREAPEQAIAFAREVRRVFPFIPLMGGTARRAFGWRGTRIGRGDWVLFGLHASNHDPRLWDDPDAFRPERFLAQPARCPYSHGAGDRRFDHRCPGEGLTDALIARWALLLSTEIDWQAPEQDFSVPMNRFPTAPRDGMKIIVTTPGAPRQPRQGRYVVEDVDELPVRRAP